MAERIGNLGYFALVKEATKGVPLTPTDFIPMYKEALSTLANFVKDNPVAGHKFMTNAVIQGKRSHKGDVTVMAEPNTAARLFDMVLTKGSVTGSNPYTYPFTLSATNPNSYTVDISTGNVVKRFWGVEASKISPSWDKNEMRLQLSLSALGSFQGREIASVSTTTITLKTDYDPAPNKGLVSGDLVRIRKASDGTTLDTTVASVNVDGITVVLGASAAAFAAGDFIYLRPATVSFNNLTPFMAAKTNWRFGATASAAASATPTPVELTSDWEISHKFQDDDGAQRTGSFDPAALVRLQGDLSLKVKKFFDTPEDIAAFNALTKEAVVISHYAGSTNQYELRLTVNHTKVDKPMANVESGNVNYSELELLPQQDASDAQAFDVKVINALSSI